MDAEAALNALDSVMIIGISVPSVLMATRITLPKIRTVSVLLASFLVIHGVYHLLSYLESTYSVGIFDFLSDGLAEPLSYLVLLAFAVLLYRLGSPRR